MPPMNDDILYRTPKSATFAQGAPGVPPDCACGICQTNRREEARKKKIEAARVASERDANASYEQYLNTLRDTQARPEGTRAAAAARESARLDFILQEARAAAAAAATEKDPIRDLIDQGARELKEKYPKEWAEAGEPEIEHFKGLCSCGETITTCACVGEYRIYTFPHACFNCKIARRKLDELIAEYPDANRGTTL